MSLQRASEIRATSQLCDDTYKAPHTELPPVIPPRWLHRGLWATVAGSLLLTAWVLLSPMDEFVSAAGIVRPGEFSMVFSQAGGILESITVRDGETVKTGQILAKLDSAEQERRLARLRQEIEQAGIELALARSTERKVAAAPVPSEFLFSGVEVERQREIQNLQQSYLSRLEELEKSGAASGVELLNLRLQLIATEAMLKRSEKAFALLEGDYGQAAAAEARERVRLIESRLRGLQEEEAFQRDELARRLIAAPRDGVVLATSATYPGERIEVGAPLFQIAVGAKKELRLYATEDRIDRIQPGQAVRFRSNNNPDRLAPMATGRVLEVNRELDLTDSSTRPSDSKLGEIYRVNVAVDNEPYPLAVGASVQAEIVLGRRPFWRLLLQNSQQ